MPTPRRRYHVFIIPPQGEIVHTTQAKAPDLEQLQAAVQGYIETVPYFTKYTTPDGQTYSRGRCYANEEGILRAMPPNIRATTAWREQFAHATALLGPVIFYAKEPSHHVK